MIVAHKEQRLDNYDLVVLLLLDLHVGGERPEVGFEHVERFLLALRAALAQNADHAVEHDRMRVAGGEGKVLGQNIRHGGLRLVPGTLDCPAVILCRGQNVRSREEKHGGKAEEREVDAEITAAAPRDDAVHQCRRTREDDRQRDPTVGGIRMLVDALGLGGCGKLSGYGYNTYMGKRTY